MAPFDGNPNDFTTETTTTQDPSLEGLIAWLETQDPETEYYYWCDNCLMGSYYRRLGYDVHCVGIYGITMFGERETRFPAGFAEIAKGLPSTYGAALDRARTLLAAREPGR